jgi:ribonuclease Z
VHYFLREYQQLEDIGISEDPIGNGVIQIVNDALNYRYDEYKTKGAWAFTANLPWLDMQLYVPFFALDIIQIYISL